MKRNENFVIASVVLFVIATSLFTWKSCSNKNNANKARILAEKAYRQAMLGEQDRSSPEIMLLKTDFYLFNKKKMKNCYVHSKKSNIYPNDHRTECFDITCKMITNNDIVATLKSPKASIDHQTKNITFPGPVESTFDKWFLNQKEVEYEASSHTIRTKETELTSEGIRVSAKKSKIDLKNKSVLLEGEVVSEFSNSSFSSISLKK